MKAYDIISRGFALAGEDIEDWACKEAALTWLNIAVADSMSAENLIREKNGKRAAEETDISSMDTEVDMDDRICRACLPLYITSMLYENRENREMAVDYLSRFRAALQSAAGALETGVTDIYGGTE